MQKITVLIIVTVLTQMVYADDSTPSKPLWEFGLGFTVFESPQYRGDTSHEVFMFPYPYMIYRGKFLNIDRSGIKGKIFESDRLKLDISGNGATRVKSSETDLRKGMPDLDPTFELGPAVNYIFYKNPERALKIGLSLTYRAVFSTDFTNIKFRGWSSNPHFYYDSDNFLGKNLLFGISTGPVWSDGKFHNFYYEVRPQDSIANIRPAYRTGSGYTAWRTTVTFSKRFTKKFWIGSFVRFDLLDGAEYAQSPLVSKNSFAIIGVATSYLFLESGQHIHR